MQRIVHHLLLLLIAMFFLSAYTAADTLTQEISK